MDKSTTFTVTAQLLEGVALAGTGEDYKNPLLSWVKLVFADDKPNANKQGVSKEEFPNLIQSMAYMPIKAKYDAESGLEGHSEASIVGVIKQGIQEDNKILAIGALFSDEHSDVVDFFKKEVAEGRQVDFSWEIRYKDSETKDGVEWLKGTTTKAITAVRNPAYEGRTPLVSISSKELIKAIEDELKSREVVTK